MSKHCPVAVYGLATRGIYSDNFIKVAVGWLLFNQDTHVGTDVASQTRLPRSSEWWGAVLGD